MSNTTSASNPAADFGLINEEQSLVKRVMKAQTLQIVLVLIAISGL